jgi:hypothetical protein
MYISSNNDKDDDYYDDGHDGDGDDNYDHDEDDNDDVYLRLRFYLTRGRIFYPCTYYLIMTRMIRFTQIGC